jgi:4,5-dihydroxyphthalate decarboxylase
MPITLAIDRYDRHFPFFDGTLGLPRGLDLSVLQVGETGSLRDGAHRHKRMLREGEFDAAEVSLSSYVMAKARGLPFTAIPAFPRRLFSQTQMFTTAASGIAEPAQLAGRRVGLQSFQTTLAVLAKGDLAHEYGVDPASVDWIVRSGETIPFELPSGWSIEYVPADADLGVLLADGALDALFFSRVPSTLDGTAVRRLFADPAAACATYFRRNGFFPIMHVVALRAATVAANPDLPRRLLDLFARAKAIADGYRDDPGWSQLAWARLEMERQQAALGADPWPIGLAANRASLERFIGYSSGQGLIDRGLSPEELFHSSVLDG